MVSTLKYKFYSYFLHKWIFFTSQKYENLSTLKKYNMPQVKIKKTFL